MPKVIGDVELLTTEQVEECLKEARRGRTPRVKVVVQLCETILAKRAAPKPKPVPKKTFFKKKEDSDE